MSQGLIDSREILLFLYRQNIFLLKLSIVLRQILKQKIAVSCYINSESDMKMQPCFKKIKIGGET